MSVTPREMDAKIDARLSEYVKAQTILQIVGYTLVIIMAIVTGSITANWIMINRVIELHESQLYHKGTLVELEKLRTMIEKEISKRNKNKNYND